MYISKIEIENYRNFENIIVEFKEGINIIIGHNNAGKSNLLKALALIFDSDKNKKLTIDDFFKGIDTDEYFKTKDDGELLKTQPPKIVISAYISQSIGENKNNEIQPEDNNTVYEWRIKTTPFYIAKLTFEYFLPDGEEINEYVENIKLLISEEKTTKEDYWDLIKNKIIYKYVSRIYAGDQKLKNRADRDNLKKFDFQFLDAIRDVEKELFTGKNTTLRDVLRYFLDHKITSDSSLTKEQQNDKKDVLHKDFIEESSQLIESLKQRINTDPILKYSKDVGATLGGNPGFDGNIDEIELFSTLRLIVEKETGIKLPASHNGLGYNNLLYISILLAKMQMSRSGFVSQDDKKVFPMLIIEEPEAHLHPSMQFKFLKFLHENLKTQREVRQSFITTHSTHITSAVKLDEIICLSSIDNSKSIVSYPGKVFDLTKKEDQKSKAYVERFLDATKTDMLFSKKIIFVEGIAEQLLLHCLAKYINIDLEDYHVSVINVNGRYFDHFLKLFNYDESDNFKKNAIVRKVVCITDADPTRRKKNIEKSKYHKCFPFETDIDIAEFESKKISGILSQLIDKYKENTNIQIHSRTDGKGKTFEYELVQTNPNNDLLIIDGMANERELKNIMNAINEKKSLGDILNILSNKELATQINKSNWEDEDKINAIIAARYLQSIENSSDFGKGDML